MASDNDNEHDWIGIGSLPFAAAVLVALNGLSMALVAFGNITDFDTNRAFVQHVLAMDTTNFTSVPGENLNPRTMWRAIGSGTLGDIAYVAIIAWETLTAIVLLGSLVPWWRGRERGYARARSVSTIGLLMLVALFFGGFIVIGGEWLQMWTSSQWNGIDAAFRNTVLAMIALVVVQMPSPQWSAGIHAGNIPSS